MPTGGSRLRVAVGLVAGVAFFSAATVHGQDRWPVSLEVNAGPSYGWQDGGYRGKRMEGLGAEILGAVRAAHVGASGLIAALSYGVQGGGDCDAICIPAPDGGCVPCFPEFSVLAVGVGIETANAGFRVLAGPAYVSGSTDRTRLDRGGSSTAGVQARLDWALPAVAHVSLCASLRAVLVPDYTGDSFRFLTGGLGLRLR